MAWLTRLLGGGLRNAAQKTAPSLEPRASAPAVKAAFSAVKTDVESVRAELARHEAQLAELMNRATPERVEKSVSPAAADQAEPEAATRTIDRGEYVSRAPQMLSRALDSARPKDARATSGITLTPAQRLILEALAADGGDRYLGYADIGALVGRSPGSVKFLINQLKQKGVQFDMVTSTGNQSRYRINAGLRQLLGEHGAIGR